MTEAEFAARIQLMREQAAAAAKEAEELEAYMAKGIWLITIIAGQRNEKNFTRDRGGGGACIERRMGG